MTVLALASLGGATGKGSFQFFVTSSKVAEASTITCHCHWCYRAKTSPMEEQLNRVREEEKVFLTNLVPGLPGQSTAPSPFCPKSTRDQCYKTFSK